MPSSSKRLVTLGVSGALIAAFAVSFFVGSRRRGGAVSHGVYDAWYAETPDGPVIVVELQTYRGAITHMGSSQSTASRRAYEAKTTVRLHSHRLSDGALLGSFSRDDVTVAGSWKDRLWVCDERGNPQLLSAETLQVVADRAAIRRALGGDYETSNRCYVNQYTGRLALKAADGNSYWIDTDLTREPVESTRVTPQGWSCGPGGARSLIEPREVECLSPRSAPATSLALSKASALAKDAGRSELLSGLSARYGADTQVLWTKSLSELAGTGGAPLWLGARTLDAHRVAVMLQTADTHVHVIVLDPATGAIHDTKVLFQDALPGVAR